VGISKLKALAGLLVATGLLFAWAGGLAYQTQAVAPPALQDSPARSADAGKEKQPATVTVRIVDEDGKPIPGAQVALLGAEVGKRSGPANPEKVLAKGTTGRDGKLTLKIEAAAPGGLRNLHALVAARGFGLGWRHLALGGKDRPPTEVKLASEQVIRGRMVDLKGQSAAGVKARVIRILPEFPHRLRPGPHNEVLRRHGAYYLPETLSARDWASWPEVVTTDARGRFSIRGFARGHEIHLVVEDDRFARQELHLPADKEANVSLTGPQVLEGVVTYADTKKPVPNARLVATSSNNESRLAMLTGRPSNILAGRTDDRGRFKFNLYSGWGASVRVYPQPGDPHLGVVRAFTWPKGAVKHKLDLTMPAGVLVKGKVVEQASGKPLAEADLHYVPQTEKNPIPSPPGALVGASERVYTGADGTFQIAVPPGKGHLLVGAPSEGFAFRWVSADQMRSGTPGGLPAYHHGIVPLDLKAQDREKQVTVKLCRGVTIKGKVVGPDGKAVKRVAMFCPGELMRPSVWGVTGSFTPDARIQGVLLEDGAFELRNCDPAGTWSVFFLDAPRIGPGAANAVPAVMPAGGRAAPVVLRGNARGVGVNDLLQPAEKRLGAVVRLSGKNAGGKPVTVKLAPCGSAEITFKNAKGKPIRPPVWLELVVQDGPSIRQSREKKVAAGETAQLSGPYPAPLMAGAIVPARREIVGLTVDARGRLSMPVLIPGATYRLKLYERLGISGGDTVFERDFKVSSGKSAKLADAVVGPAGRDE
jgi:hypothetical protein